MKISLNDLLTNRKPEPSKDDVLALHEKASQLFSARGLEQTPLVKKSIPVLARILFDVQGQSLNIWSDGRPAFKTPHAESRKGILMIGTVGTGKSTAMKAMSNIIDGEYLSVPALAVLFSKKGEDALWAEIHEAKRWDLFLDDLGAEKDLKSYNNAFPMAEIIYRRYDLWQASGARTHLSTNLSGDQIGERYGERVRDRLREMTTVISCTGKSLRK